MQNALFQKIFSQSFLSQTDKQVVVNNNGCLRMRRPVNTSFRVTRNSVRYCIIYCKAGSYYPFERPVDTGVFLTRPSRRGPLRRGHYF